MVRLVYCGIIVIYSRCPCQQPKVTGGVSALDKLLAWNATSVTNIICHQECLAPVKLMCLLPCIINVRVHVNAVVYAYDIVVAVADSLHHTLVSDAPGEGVFDEERKAPSWT